MSLEASLSLLARLEGWMEKRGWSPLPFQREVWNAQLQDQSGLLQVATGSGKTYAAFFGALARSARAPEGIRDGKVRILYLTPLRALSRDIEMALRLPTDELELGITVASRTGDTTAYRKKRQRISSPHVLVTTPESLAVWMASPGAREDFRELATVIVDEWHELLSTKRGSLLELSLARLRAWSPAITWGLSATIENTHQAAQSVCGVGVTPRWIRADLPRPIRFRLLAPQAPLPWAGHLGLSMIEPLITDLSPGIPTILFCNTRSQAERWFEAIQTRRPEWGAAMGIHHGSIDREGRERVELGLKSGDVWLCVATSSLDLGIDLPRVERVYQVGSPKAVARVVQRAGRSQHRPGETSEIVFVPTHAMEVLEVVACRRALDEGNLECRVPLEKPLDVLSQHVVSCASSEAIFPQELLTEVRQAYSYQKLSELEWNSVVRVVCEGGSSLRAYPAFRRVERTAEGRLAVRDARIARIHRFNIGTIVSDASVRVRFVRGGYLGSIEETYIARLRPGDVFLFSGRPLQFVRLREMTAYVRLAKRRPPGAPRWMGSRLPLSPPLSARLREVIGELSQDRDPIERRCESVATCELVTAQLKHSALPQANEVLIELTRTREGTHLFVFPFEGHSVHEGMAALVAWRLSRHQAVTFSLSANDYGFEIVSPGGFSFEDHLRPELFASRDLAEAISQTVRVSEMEKRQFREVARIAGLVVAALPGNEKSSKQLQASSALLYDVLTRYEPDHCLVREAMREVAAGPLEQARLGQALERIEKNRWKTVTTPFPSPFAFPLILGRSAGQVSTETLNERLERMKRKWLAATKPSAFSRKGHSTGLAAIS